MDHVRLGGTGLLVSRLCLGTMTFGLQCDEATSHAILDTAAEGGITFIDTADVYPLGGGLSTVGRTEEIVGSWLRGKRERFVVATKCFGRTGRAQWDQGNSRKHILEAVDASLRRLSIDYIDLYQLHGPDPNTPMDETLGALDDLVRSGKVRHVGCSNFLAYSIARALGRSEARAVVRFDSVQPRYNLLFRQIERELLPLCQEEGLGVIPYNPIAGGLLSGKHDPSAGPTEGTRFTLGNAADNYQNRYWHDREFATVEELRKISEREEVSLVTLAVAWVLAHPAVTAPIVGASRPDQLEPSLAAAEFRLSAELKDELDAVTREYRLGTRPGDMRAMVTGATRGIGKATALALAAAGWDVAITGRTRRPGEGRDDSDTGGGRPVVGSLEESADLVRASGCKALALVADLHDQAALRGAVAQVVDEWGGVDLLVNNAVDTGPGSMVPVLELTVAQLESKLAANVVAQFVLVQAVLPGMIAQGRGVIINVTSHTATADPPGPVGQGGWGLGYAASKAAFHRFAPLVAVELGARGIRSFNLDPGYVDTERQQANAAALGLVGHYQGAPPSVPAAAIVWLAENPDATDNGSTVRAQKLALTHHLHADWRAPA